MTISAERIEIRTTRAFDLTIGACALLLAPLGIWGAGGGMWHVSRDSMYGRGSWLAVPFYDTFGWRGVVVAVALLAFWMTCNGVGAAWRLWDRRPATLASEAGIQFHPSIGPSLVPWSDVSSIRWVANATPPEIEIRLSRRFWSPWNWATSPKVRFNHRAIGLSDAEAASRVRELRALMHQQLPHGSRKDA
jgi:hypothetical protein